MHEKIMPLRHITVFLDQMFFQILNYDQENPIWNQLRTTEAAVVSIRVIYPLFCIHV